MVIPDTQVKPGVPLDHLAWAGDYAHDKNPDMIIHLGDFADMPSLSSYDKGKKSYENRRYKLDIDATRKALGILDNFLYGKHKLQRDFRVREEVNRKQLRPELPTYDKQRILLLGNHEDRIRRAIEDDPKLDGTISIDDLGYGEFGWKVFPYLEVFTTGGVAFSHYFTTGIMGKPVTSARALLTKRHMSSVMGHVQRRDIAYDYAADGKQVTGIFAGSYYLHEEDYLGPQGNKHWRGIWMLHNVHNGEFDEMPVSLGYLRDRFKRKYGTTKGDL